MVQVDKTVICHGNVDSFPSQLVDNFPGITWLVGFIDENIRKIKYKIVADRSEETFKNLFERIVIPGTTVITDGHASYPERNAIKTEFAR